MQLTNQLLSSNHERIAWQFVYAGMSEIKFQQKYHNKWNRSIQYKRARDSKFTKSDVSVAASVKYSLLSSSYALLLSESAMTPPSTAVITSCRSESANERNLGMFFRREIKSCRDYISCRCHKRSCLMSESDFGNQSPNKQQEYN